MKRVIFHVLFWIVYLTQDTLLAFLWDGPEMIHHYSVTARVFMAAGLCVSLVIPKIIFTYLLLYVILDRILAQRTRIWTNIFFLLLATISTILACRIIEIWFVNSVIFHRTAGSQFFRLSGFIFAVIDLGFVSGMAIALRQIGLQLASKEHEKVLIKEKLETELKFLKNQTNPHFLFNTLNNIYALARKKSDSTPDVVMKLSKILRFMLYESGRKFITIAEEVKLIEDYIDLERIRYNERLNISFQKDIDNDGQEVSPLLLLPFVENAFKHGVSETRFSSFVQIDLKLKDGRLAFTIANSKAEAIGEQPQEKEKIGLCNIRRQLELMYNEYNMEVDNGHSSFNVNLTINLKSHGKI
jgi:two-component system LytT family sensor kinase